MNLQALGRFGVAVVVAAGCAAADTPEEVSAQFVNAVRERDCPALSEISHPEEAPVDCADPELYQAWPILDQVADLVAQRLDAGDRFMVEGERAVLEYDCGGAPCQFELGLYDGDWYVVDVD